MIGKKPVKVGDSAGMTQEEFAKSRIGIGGSDQAVLYGYSPWNSMYGLWAKCCGMKKYVFKEEDDYAKEKGHILEPLVAEVFQRKTGFKVINDTGIYHHADYSFMRVNLDRMYERETQDKYGNKKTIRGVLELKTTFPENAAVEEYWKKGKCPEYYRLQVLFYLAVMDLDEAYIACMWGFDEKKNYACVRIERNMEEEADLIERNVRFWNTYVIPRKKPPLELSKKPKNTLADLRAYSGFADPNLPCVIFHPDYSVDVEEMEAVDEQIAELKARIKELEEIKLRLEIPFVEAMGQATVGMIPARENDSYYEVAYKARKQTVISAKNLMEKHPELMSEYTKVKIGELRADYPQICEELSEQAGDENRSMKIRKKKFTAKTRSIYRQRMAQLQKGACGT